MTSVIQAMSRWNKSTEVRCRYSTSPPPPTPTHKLYSSMKRQFTLEYYHGSRFMSFIKYCWKGARNKCWKSFSCWWWGSWGRVCFKIFFRKEQFCQTLPCPGHKHPQNICIMVHCGGGGSASFPPTFHQHGSEKELIHTVPVTRMEDCTWAFEHLHIVYEQIAAFPLCLHLSGLETKQCLRVQPIRFQNSTEGALTNLRMICNNAA